MPLNSNSLKSRPGFSALICGVSGTGKSYCQRTARRCINPGTGKPLEAFSIVTDRHSLAVIQEEPAAHYIYIPPVAADWSVLQETFANTNKLTYEGLCGMKAGIRKPECTQLLKVVAALNKFECEHCGKNFGDVSQWKTDRLLIIDHLSGISTMSRQLTVGLRQIMSQGEYGVAMTNISNLLSALTGGCSCHLAVMAHIEQEKDDVSGLIYHMAQTLGQKLAPQLPKEFSDVIRADKQGTSFFWTTVYNNMAVKGINAEIASNLAPSFEVLFNGWLKRGGVVEETPNAA